MERISETLILRLVSEYEYGELGSDVVRAITSFCEHCGLMLFMRYHCYPDSSRVAMGTLKECAGSIVGGEAFQGEDGWEKTGDRVVGGI